ncbi:metalloendopeptidase-like membrane protein [Leptolyngbya sp. Heron Island J]|nr:metalloendopeptidase-like membrane protein [Leptolyngbya sp. Heron Island J]
MGSQPVLAQINIPTGETAAPAVAAEAAPLVTATPDAPAASALVTPPVVVSPEAAPPSFSPTPAASSAVEAITSQVEIEIVVPAADPASEAEAAPTELKITAADVEEAVEEITEIDATVEETDTATVATDVEIPDVENDNADGGDDSIEAEDASTDGEDVSVDGEGADGAVSELEDVTPEVEIVTPSDVVPGAIPTGEDLASEDGEVFVDPSEEEEGEKEEKETLESDGPEVVVSERSTGCEYTVDAEHVGGCEEAGEESEAVASVPETNAPETSVKLGPVSISRSGVRFSGGATTAAGREFYNTVARPLVELQAGQSFVFPLAAPSPITSLFGWRWHPIHHDYRFHSGTDLGAPQGTPILATQSGQVSVADYLGGYGLTVILRHNDNTLESRYAHMSHILAQPGEWVEQGEVIGLVGSTGNSTGPHLHFELRQLTSQGWSAINPDDVLRYALANLNNQMNGRSLQALNIIHPAHAASAQAALPKGVKTETLVKDAPHFRPAQPHAQ